jgi:hypothetical protein
MKFLMSVAAVLALVVGFNLTAIDDAEARCGWRCQGAVLVPAPHPIPLRRARRRIFVAPAPVVVVPAPVVVVPQAVAVVPAPTEYYYTAPAYYASYTQPAYAGRCDIGPRNCYWRRNCWYDSFGRRFCN